MFVVDATLVLSTSIGVEMVWEQDSRCIYLVSVGHPSLSNGRNYSSHSCSTYMY